MSKQISTHRMGAFIYGFLCGVGLIMMIWGVASIAMLRSSNLMMNIGLVLFGALLFAGGSCREAYLRGNLSASPDIPLHTKRNQIKLADLTSEQIIQDPEEIKSQEPHAS